MKEPGAVVCRLCFGSVPWAGNRKPASCASCAAAYRRIRRRRARRLKRAARAAAELVDLVAQLGDEQLSGHARRAAGRLNGAGLSSRPTDQDLQRARESGAVPGWLDG